MICGHFSTGPFPRTLRIRPVAHLIARHQYFQTAHSAFDHFPHPVAPIFQLSKLADVQNLHICCFHSGPEISVLSLSPFPQHFPGHFSVGISLPLACICLPFRFGTICHWQAVILWLVSWVCLPVCPASLWTPTSARVDFKGSLAGFRAPRTLRLSVSPSFLSVSLSHL